ncbi:MAG: UDP-N-acetylglucosamine 1-carboxyvinyltransferase [Oscillospiraceae bacterium]|nr:UDP-N-acetylglucosamine 1-carboxyvinyltransferase [Oscillospiraceae bacterium]
MEQLSLYGGYALSGETTVQGAKNSALPILAATVLSGEECILENCPHLSDVETACEILRYLGAQCTWEGETLFVCCKDLRENTIPQALMQKMRSSILFLGALCARTGRAELSMPGGCQLGDRPIDLHIDALRALGAVVETSDAIVYCQGGDMGGGSYRFPFPSVGATENAMLAAMGCKGPVSLENPAKEPEISDLGVFLQQLGATVGGIGTEVMTILPPQACKPVRHRIIPDRIAAATYLCAVASAGGKIVLQNVDASQLTAVIAPLRRAGCKIRIRGDTLTAARTGALAAPGMVATAPYPGFPTDAQTMLLAAMLRADGITGVQERIFSDRFRQLPQLQKLGAEITIVADTAYVTGVRRLYGAQMRATDLRGGAALAVAALAAEGESIITALDHLDRGYEHIERDLCNLGAKAERKISTR